MAESQPRALSKNKPANDFTLLNAVSGKGYRIKTIVVNASNTAASTGGSIDITAYDPVNGGTVSLCRVQLVDAVANAVNVVIPCDFITKPGTRVYVLYFNEDHTVAKDVTDFGYVNISMQYTEIETSIAN